MSFVVNKFSQFMHQPTKLHWTAIKHVLHYLEGTITLSLHLQSSPCPSLHVFFDADWASNKDDHKSTTAYIVYIGQNAL